jgi:hypothetical protein
MSDVLDGELSPAAPVEPQATAEPVAEAPESTAEQETEQKPEAPPKTFTQDELDKIVQKRLAKESRRIEKQVAAEVENRYLREQLKPAPVSQVADGKPQLAQFQDYESYTEALVDWKAEQKIVEREAKQREAYQQQAQIEQQKQAVQEVNQKFGSILESKPDVADIVLEKNFPISDPMLGAMMSSDVADKLLEHIANNPKTAAEIYELPPATQFRKVMELEAKLKMPLPKTTKAPEPVKGVSNGSSFTKSIEDMSIAEYKAWRAKNGARIT